MTNFFGRKSTKHDKFFYIWIILLQINFFGNRLTKSVFFLKLGRYHYIYAYWLQFKDFLKIMLLVNQNLPRDACHPSSIKKLKKNID